MASRFLGWTTDVLGIMMLVLLTCPAQAALNLEADRPEHMVAKLRDSIFVETSHLRPRRRACSSLDGPRCARWMLAKGGVDDDLVGPLADIAGLGVIPDQLRQDFGVNSVVEFLTPEYNLVEHARRVHDEINRLEEEPVSSIAFAGTGGAAVLRGAGHESKRGVLHFAGLAPDRRVPLGFSEGLPGKLVATWDGRWMVNHCSDSGVESSAPLQLPSVEAPLSLHSPAFMHRSGPLAVSGDEMVSSLAAELVDNVGYVRFSKPVLVRSLLARWHHAGGSQVPVSAIVGGRLGLRTMWVAHLNPDKLKRQGWLDIGGDPLALVDEIAFVAAKGLEIGAVEVALDENATELGTQERAVLLLEPLSRPSSHGSHTAFQLRPERLAASAAPYVMSLREVLERGLRLTGIDDPEDWPRGLGQPIPSNHPALGLMTARTISSGLVDQDSVGMVATAALNEDIFEHHGLSKLLALFASEDTRGSSRHPARERRLDVRLAARGLVNVLAREAERRHLPLGLLKVLRKERVEIEEALVEFASGGSGNVKLPGWRLGWRPGTPLRLPLGDSETDSAMSGYTKAKVWQTKLDVLTAVLLHLNASRF